MPYRSNALDRLFLALAVFAAGGAVAHAGPRPVVVELFTSQGCSSCVPADALMGQLAGRKDVIAMSLPITYWDMLGWKDTLASDPNTKRQKAYSEAMHRGGVYTPQMIVDGVDDLVGSRDAAIQAAITARAADQQSVPIKVTTSPTEVHIEVGEGKGGDATIWLFRILPKASVSISAGENSGHTMTYRNIVQDVKAVGLWKGQPVTLDLPKQEIAGAPKDEIAVIVQQGGYGRIIGAALVDKPAL
jgi:hypothetical protein